MGLESSCRAPSPMESSGVPGHLFGVLGPLFRSTGNRSREKTNSGAQKPHFWIPEAPKNLPKTITNHEIRCSQTHLSIAWEFRHCL